MGNRHSPKMTIELTASPKTDDVAFVRERLNEYNSTYLSFDDGYMPLTVLLRDSSGSIVGGLTGCTYWGWLNVDILWIDEQLRGQGYGQKLLSMAEQEAIHRGCRHAHLDTMSWQAQSFYEKQGYSVFGQLTDLPQGHSRYFMKKDLITKEISQ